MFETAPSRVSMPELDARILEYWKERDVFRRSELERPDAPQFVLYEGPPTANGSPGIHHVLARVFKDVICRYRTMKGYRCVRKGGWDTHGLPVELEVEKELGLSSKREIEEYGIEKFNQRCRENVFRYVKEWEALTDRIGFWVDMEDPYVTLDNDFIESGWWILKQLWDRGLLYEGLRGTPHCPRCETSLSSHEVALGYREDTPDPSAFVKFRLTEPSAGLAVVLPTDTGIPTYFLAWTTTPWTLPGNAALAVDAVAEYSLVELERERDGEAQRERLILATQLLPAALQEEYTVVATRQGGDLLGSKYEPLYDPFAPDYDLPVDSIGRLDGSGGVMTYGGKPADWSMEYKAEISKKSWQVHPADFVSMEDGAGIVHIAPAFGDEDLGLGRERGLAFVQPVDLQGQVTGSYPFAGKFVKEADEDIMRDLAGRGRLHRRAIYRHTYPFCWRCDTPLLYYAKSSWYIRTTAYKDRLVDGNSSINWYPEYIREGRFGEWLRNNVDWAISRERYWGTPIPIWQCQDCGHRVCVGSVAELKEAAGQDQLSELDDLNLHRPYVDDLILNCSAEGCSGRMQRIPEVMDAWFDSGAMPFAQWHYPFDNPEVASDGRFPADYICEAVDQTRGWFYSLHALATLLKEQPAFRNVICLGLILDSRGQKMSKHVGNVVQPNTALDAHGADALRWYLFTASHPGEARRFSDKLVGETLRRVLLTLWNVYSFFTNYATIDRFHPDQVPAGWKPESELDRWILSELNVLVSQVDGYLDAYNPTDAGRRIQEFIDGLSNWYVRRSRRRFWKSENDTDKISAYATLYRCLITVARLMAPLAPFMAEEMYRNLVCSVDPSAPDSVHLGRYPVADASLVDQDLMEATRLAMQVSSMGRAARAKAGLKVRQPLAQVQVWGRPDYLRRVAPQILEELNIKELKVLDSGKDAEYYRERVREASQVQGGPDFPDRGIYQVDNYWVSLEPNSLVAIDANVTPELAEEGLARELAHRIQGLRRSAQFELIDRIVTYYQGPEKVAQVMRRHADYISQETLSEELVSGPPDAAAKSELQKVEGMEVTLGVKRL